MTPSTDCSHCKGLKASSPLCKKHLEALKSLWYKKLKQKGFDDIEQDEDHLKRWTSSSLKTDGYQKHEAREEYYRLAGQFAHEHTFSSKQEKFMWQKHAEGATIKEIIVLANRRGMKTEEGTKIYKRFVHEIIQRLAKIMVNKCLPKNRP